MNFTYLLITLKQVGTLFFYVIAGMVLRKTGKFGKSASGVIATLLIFFISPCYSLVKMSENFSVSLISTYLEMFSIGIGVTVVCVVFSLVVARFFADSGYMRNVYKYAFAFGNIGFFGNPLIEAVFGGSVLVQYLIFSLPMNITLGTYGFIILTDNGENKTKEEKRKHIIKVLLNPSTVFLIIGIVLGLCSVKLPTIMVEFLTPAINCYSALPMILLGSVLGGFEIKKLFSSGKAYVVGGVKLILFPAVFGLISYVAHLLGASVYTCLMIVLLTALPPGMNIVTYPESFGIDSSEGGKTLFVSYILAIITLPVVIMIATSLLGV